MGLLDAAFRSPDTSEEARTDWVFLVFVAFALVMSAHTLVQRTRLRNALRLATACLAQADPQCARDAVEEARAFDALDLRVRVATVDLALLLGDAERAETALGALAEEATTRRLRPAERADLLLTQGDLASVRGDPSRAKELYEEASPLIDPGVLVRPRVERLAERERQRRVLLAALFGDLDLLLRAAEGGDADAVVSRARDLFPRISKLGNKEAADKLSAAVSAVQRIATRPRGGASADLDAFAATRPRPPVKSAVQTPEADAVYEAQRAAYVEAIADWETRRTEAERTRRELAEAATATGEPSLDEVRKQVEEARGALEAPGGRPR
jgi:hypothetical protein